MFLSPFPVVAKSLLGAYKNAVHMSSISSSLITQSGANTFTRTTRLHVCWIHLQLHLLYITIIYEHKTFFSPRWSAAAPPRVPEGAPSTADARTSALLLASGQKSAHCWSPQLHTGRVPQFHSGMQRTKLTIVVKFESVCEVTHRLCCALRNGLRHRWLRTWTKYGK